MATQNVRQHNFPEPFGGRGVAVGQIGPQSSGNVNSECDENDRLFTTFCDPHTGHPFSLFFYTFHPEKDIKSGF